ncbi:dTDP-4-dehydrorhamnose reductase [Nitzschia inconspicua]|uniref:dTDP-4-dehydrorhamnose reductase n=1 Tax=Nitzschia inconspicua TaxID=303405 RepID=A0A9K3KGK0_9STRA|nr:dTDP-4-dehydrorhamnose reductase [Nitzschia inconspicua]
MKTSLQIVLTGASGYLGQHLLSHWMKDGGPKSESSFLSSSNEDVSSPDKIKILALYNRLEGFPTSVKELKGSKNVEVTVQSIDLTDVEAMNELGKSIFQVDESSTTTTTTVVVHTAAMSSPRVCQEDPNKANAINVPVHFFNAVSNCPMIALSTDQVYDGKQTPAGSLYKESDRNAVQPANAYGQSKLNMEEYLIEQRHNDNSPPLFLLRSSIILGPPAPFGGAHSTFFDFCQSQGAKGEATAFFTNEYRTVVSVQYVIQVIDDMILYSFATNTAAGAPHEEKMPMVYNMGGPFRVNRWDMAKAVFDHFGYESHLLQESEQTSPYSPLDISMDSTLLKQKKFGGPQHEPDSLEGLVKYVFS